MLLFAHIKILNFGAEMALVPMRIVYTLQMNWRFRSWHLIFEINKPSTHIQQYDVHLLMSREYNSKDMEMVVFSFKIFNSILRTYFSYLSIS